MECKAMDNYGAFDCDCCIIDALIRCKSQNEEAYKKWGDQLNSENPERMSRIKAILKGEFND